jgi:hypothetical protein
MSIEVLENQIRGLNIVFGALQAATGDICKNCGNMEGAKITVGKMVKKLDMDLDAAAISPEKTKADLRARIDSLSKAADELDIAEECTCQKTAGNCKLGAECFVTAAIDLMKLVK